MELPCRPSRSYVEVDRVRMVQALSNLLNNAAKSTRAGGLVSLRVPGTPASAWRSVCGHRHRHRPGDAAARMLELFSGAASLL